MIPLRDSVRPDRRPVVTVGLIVVNLLVFAWELSLGPAAGDAIVRLGVVPNELVGAVTTGPLLPEVGTVFTSMFLHADLLHFLGNMWFLWIFGDNVEDRLGRPGFLVFYLACGVAAAVSQVAVVPESGWPMIGASGAIAGVLGAYLWLYPRARVLTVVPIFLFLHFLELPAIAFLGVWFVVQLLSGYLGDIGVAWWAHVAGFVAGLLVALFVPRGNGRRPTRHRGLRGGRASARGPATRPPD